MQEGTRRILKLCLVTAARVGEVAGMSVDEVDLDRRVWTIPAHRSKNKLPHVLPLPDLAVELIRAQLAEVRKVAAKREARLARRIVRMREASDKAEIAGNGPELIFPGSGSRGPINVSSVGKAIQYSLEHFGVAPFTPHDLRRTAATRMEEIGISPFIVAHVLGHVSVTKASITSKVYARYDYAREKREAVERWAAHLRGIAEGAAVVLPFSDPRWP
jgi:integrase